MDDIRQARIRRGQGGRWQPRGGRGGCSGRGERANGNKKNKRPQNLSTFIGASSMMLGHVFQVNRGQRKRGQFKGTVDMIKIYASENFKRDMSVIESLFGDDIQKPKVKEPREPMVKKDEKEVTKTQIRIYEAKITAFVREEKSLEDSLTALFNVIWRQCSVMM